MKRSLIFASDLFIMCDLGKRDFISQLFFITKLKMKLLQIVSYTLAIVYSSVAQNPGKMKKNETFFSIFYTLCIRRDESCQNLIFSTFPPLLSLQLFWVPRENHYISVNKISFFPTECTAPIFLDWSNMTIREGSTALFKCPVDMSASCLADSSIQWYKLNPLDPEQKLLLEDSRLELFSSDPLLM